MQYRKKEFFVFVFVLTEIPDSLPHSLLVRRTRNRKSVKSQAPPPPPPPPPCCLVLLEGSFLFWLFWMCARKGVDGKLCVCVCVCVCSVCAVCVCFRRLFSSFCLGQCLFCTLPGLCWCWCCRGLLFFGPTLPSFLRRYTV